jgi:acetolactate synthase regulatory subunit
MSDILKNHILNIIIDNEFGALARVIELFSARGYNIETLSVAPVSNQQNVSVITITTNCNDKTIALICKLLQKIVPVHTAKHGFVFADQRKGSNNQIMGLANILKSLSILDAIATMMHDRT